MKINHTWSISPNKFRNDIIDRNLKLGDDACEIMAKAINAVNPYRCVLEIIKLRNRIMSVNKIDIDLEEFDRVYILGFGKAAVPMADAVMSVLDQWVDAAVLITKDPRFLEFGRENPRTDVLLGGHPIPSLDSITSTQRVVNSFQRFTERDLVFVLISGGGSALFTKPVEGVSLEDLKRMTKLLLMCGASIQEINALRKHLDSVKGGGLLQWLHPAHVETLILSDVIGDRLDLIASGPTVPDPTTFEDAMQVIKKYDLYDLVPVSIIQHLSEGINRKIPETLKPGDFNKATVKNTLVGTNYKSAQAACIEAEKLGYRSMIVSSHLTGNTKYISEFLGGIIKSVLMHGVPVQRPACLILGGETTVEIKGSGLGGRNQDLALHMVEKMSDKHGVLFISLATDGEDGPTDASGAVVDSQIFSENLETEKINLMDCIKNNDSFHFFKRLGGLITTGATGTNVNDLILIMFD